MKICYRCDINKKIIDFSKDGNGGYRNDCKNCRNLINKKYRQNNPKKMAKLKKTWRDVNTAHIKEYSKIYHRNNNAKRCAYNAQWRRANPGKNNAKARRYSLSKIQRVPIWADHNAIRNIYINCPKGMQVDHIIPLNGKTVSGLHVVGNLQYLTPNENQTKSNKF